MILGKEDFMARLKELAGDTPDDKTLSLVEDFTDTINNYETATKDNSDWKTKYEENDKAWREKYTARFFDGRKDAESAKESEEVTEAEKTRYEELFKEEK